jgi:hypothetical protein
MVSRKDLQLPEPDEGAAHERPIAAIVGERLTLTAFHQIAGNLAGYPFVKLVVDRPAGIIHFLNSAVYPFHGDPDATWASFRQGGATHLLLDYDSREFLATTLESHVDELALVHASPRRAVVVVRIRPRP